MESIKAKITRVSDSKKSIMVFVPENPTALSNPLTATNAVRTNAFLTLPEDQQGKFNVGEEIELPTGYSLVGGVTEEGEVMAFSDGTPMSFVKW